jgi:uncharacterized membrane protein (DUF373 family)
MVAAGESMEDSSTQGKLIRKVESVVIGALEVLVVLLVISATIILYFLFQKSVRSELAGIETVEELLEGMQRSFAGILTVVLGLELLETLKVYFAERSIRVEVILIVAIIAAGRHVIEIDFGHTGGTELFGFAGVIVSLTLGYFLVKRASGSTSSNAPENTKK